MVSPSLVRAGFSVGLLLLAVPFLGLLAQTAPARPSDVNWRFEAASLAFGRLILPVVGLFLVSIVSAALDERRLVRGSAIGGGLAAGATFLLLVRYAFDYLTLAGGMPQGASGFHLTAGASMVAGALEALGFGLIAITCWRHGSERGGRSTRSGIVRPPKSQLDRGP